MSKSVEPVYCLHKEPYNDRCVACLRRRLEEAKGLLRFVHETPRLHKWCCRRGKGAPHGPECDCLAEMITNWLKETDK